MDCTPKAKEIFTKLLFYYSQKGMVEDFEKLIAKYDNNECISFIYALMDRLFVLAQKEIESVVVKKKEIPCVARCSFCGTEIHRGPAENPYCHVCKIELDPWNVKLS